MDASEIHPRRINAKAELKPQMGEELIFPVADGTAKLSGRDQEFREPTLRQHRPVWSENLSGELQGESEGFQPTETDSTRMSEPPGIGKPFRGAESNVKLYVPKEETFPIPMKFIDDYWNVNVNQSLSDSWTRFTTIT